MTKITDKNGVEIKVGSILKWDGNWNKFRVVSLSSSPQLYNETAKCDAYVDFQSSRWGYDKLFVKVLSEPKQRKSSKSLYLASDANGVTIKGLVNVINNRKVDTFGNSPLQALSKYEDKYGRKLTQENGVIWKLVPYKMRQDKNGKVRVGREIK